jgi:hypothetical protein
MKGRVRVMTRVQFNAGDLCYLGERYDRDTLMYDVMEGNSIDSPLVGISYQRADGQRTNTQYVHWAMLTKLEVEHIELLPYGSYKGVRVSS